MKFESIIEKTTIKKDVKARRRLNTSKQIANITIDEIEQGVSIETLMNLNVPVYQYGGQVTIHGKLPKLNEDYINGYKSIIKNANGSLGVKYIAIDGMKKKKIELANQLSDNSKMGVHFSSTGMSLQKRFFDKTECINFYNSIPDIFYGSKYIGIYMGCYYSVIEFMSIEETELFNFIEWLTGIKSDDELIELKKARDDRYAAERLESKKEYEQVQNTLNEKIELISSLLSDKLKPAPTNFNKTVGTYCKVSLLGRIKVITIFKKEGSNRLYYDNGFDVDVDKAKSTMKGAFKSMIASGKWFNITSSQFDDVKSEYQKMVGE